MKSNEKGQIMERLTDQQRLKPWKGIIFFIAILAIFYFLGPILGGRFGLIGTAMYEFIFLACSVLMCVICRVKIKEVFPIRKPTFKDVAGCVVLTFGTAAAASIGSAITALVFPQLINALAERNTSIVSNSNPLLTIIIVSIVPAICEEAIHRGVIQSSMRGIRNDLVIALIVGFLFSVNHLSISSFLGIFIMGTIISYVMAKKNNILLTAIIHFLNNFRSVIMLLITTHLNSDAVDTVTRLDFTTMPRIVLFGVLLLSGFSAPILVTLGLFLVCRNREKSYKKVFIITGITSGAMYLTGLIIVAVYIMTTMASGYAQEISSMMII